MAGLGDARDGARNLDRGRSSAISMLRAAAASRGARFPNRSQSPISLSSSYRLSPLRLGAFAAASLVLSLSYSNHVYHFAAPKRFASFLRYPQQAATISPMLIAPQAPLSWKHTPEQVLSGTKDLIEHSRKFQDSIAALPEDGCDFDSVFKALALHEAELDASSEPLSFYQNVATDSKLRDASNDAEKLLRDFGIESSMRLDVFQALKRAEKNVSASGRELTPEEKRLMEKMLLDGKRAGLDLPDDKREKLLEVSELMNHKNTH